MPEVSLEPDQDLMSGDPDLIGNTLNIIRAGGEWGAPKPSGDIYSATPEEIESGEYQDYDLQLENWYNELNAGIEAGEVTLDDLRDSDRQLYAVQAYNAGDYTAEQAQELWDEAFYNRYGEGTEGLATGRTVTTSVDENGNVVRSYASGTDGFVGGTETYSRIVFGEDDVSSYDNYLQTAGVGYEQFDRGFGGSVQAGLAAIASNPAGAVIIGAMTAGAGTALTSAIQTATGLSTAAATAASSAIINSATQLALTGDLDPRQALASAVGGYIQGGGFGELGNSLGESELVSSVQDAWDDAMTAIDDVGGSFLKGGSEWLSKTVEAGGADAIAQLISSGEIDPEQVITAGLSVGGQELIGDFIEQYGSQLFEQNEQQAIVDSEGNVLHVFDSDEAATAWADVNYVGPTGTAEGYQLGTVGSSIPEWMIPILEGGGAAAEAIGGALDAVGIIDLGNDPNSAPPPSSGDLNTEAGYQPYFYKAPDGTTYYLNFETGEWTDVTTNPNLDQFQDQFNELGSGYYSDNLTPIGNQGGGGPNVGDIVQDVVDSIENNSPPTVTETEPPPVVTEPPPVVDGTDGTTDGVDNGADNGADNGVDDGTGGDNGNNGADNGTDGVNAGDGNAEVGDDGDGNNTGTDGDGTDGKGDGNGDGIGDGLGSGRGGSGMMSPRPFETFMTGISYQAPTIQQIVQNPQTDYTASLNDLINRNSGMFG